MSRPRSPICIAALAGSLLLPALGCDAPPTSAPPAAPAGAPAAAAASLEISAARRFVDRFFVMFDSCDPASFNAAVGPGTCVGRGRTTFGAFIAELQATRTARDWRFGPVRATVPRGGRVVAVNTGGEVHTFTYVREFGGGIVPELNAILGLPTVAPECTTLRPADFVPPLGSYEVSAAPLAGEGSARFMCCLHPWMRSTVRVTASQ